MWRRGHMEAVDFSGEHSCCSYSFQGFQHDDTISSYYLRRENEFEKNTICSIDVSMMI